MMSNEIATIPAAIMGEAYEAVKEAFGLLEGQEFSKTRTNTKGKVSVRSEVGLILSGNTAERLAHGQQKMLEYWSRGKFGVIASELLRVFPTLGKEVEKRNVAVNNLIAAQPEMADKLQLISPDNPGKLGVMAMFALAQQLKGSDKGEKAKMLVCGQRINEYEMTVQETAKQLMLSQTAVEA